MAWTYSAALEALHSRSSNGFDPSPTVKLMPIAGACSSPACPMDACLSALYGTTSGPSEGTCFHPLISSMAASHARTSALRETCEAWLVSEAVFFGKLSDLPKKSARHLFSSKMFGRYQQGSSRPSEMRLNLMVTNVETDIFPPPKSEPFTGEAGGFSLLPTLSACSYGMNKGGAAGRVGKERPSLQTMAKRGLLPTLTVKGNYNKQGLSSRSGDGLVTWLWKRGAAGPLNPVWAEVFMGYMPRWTVCEPWAMPSSPRKRAKPFAV